MIKLFFCSIENCNKTFASESHLKRHLDTCLQKQTGEKKFVCQFCSKSYTRKERMVTHIKVVHTFQNDKYLCHHCGGTYETLDSYKKHYNLGQCFKAASSMYMSEQMDVDNPEGE